MWPPGASSYRFGSFVVVVCMPGLLVVNVVVSIRVSSPVRVQQIDCIPEFEVDRFLWAVAPIELIEVVKP